jgi:S1-C subfamily serine protease
MIFSPSGASAGIGFAIPTNLSGEVMKQLIAHGKVQRGTLGLQTQDITPRIARLLGVSRTEGAVVTRVSEGSTADAAGIQPGDVITSLNGKPLRDSGELRNSEGLLPLGSRVTLDLVRDGKTREVSATLAAEKLATVDGARLDPRLAGVSFSDLSQGDRSQGLAGVRVTAVRSGSPAAQSGLRKGDLVIGVGNRRITSIRGLQVLAGVRPRQLALAVADEDGMHYVLVQ